MQTSKFRIYALIVVFSGILIFPILNHQLHLVSDIENFENRGKAKEPAFDIEHLDPFPLKYEQFYNDTFELRNSLIQHYNKYKILAFHESPFPDKVIIGNNGCLFNAGTEQETYLGKTRFTNAELEAFRLEIEYRQRYLDSMGCKLYLAIAPLKANIYPENMPREEYRVNTQTTGEQVIEYLIKNSTVKPVDIFDVFRKNKHKYDLYYTLDNHWNGIGGLFASNAIIDRVHADLPEVSALPIEMYTIKKTPLYKGNIQLMLGNLNVYDDYNYELTPKKGFKAKSVASRGYKPPGGFPYPWEYEFDREIKNSKLPEMLLICDSYGAAIFPYMAESFGRSVKIFDAWQYALNAEIVNNEKPQVCILLIHEIILHNFLLNQSRLSNK